MTKTNKKILLVVLIALLTVFALSTKAFAAEEQAIKTYTDVKLQSKSNDVVSISQKDKEQKSKVLLANGELWNLDTTTNTLTNKEKGNVKKYVYGRVYFKDGDSDRYSNGPISVSTLKNNNKLTIKTDKGSIKAKKVVDVTTFGYLTSKGKYYAIVEKDNKVIAKQKAKNVEAILHEELLKKSDGLYTIENEKIVKAKIRDAIGRRDFGYYLDNKNVLYKYTYDYSNKKYKTEKIEKNVKELLDYGVYKTKKGKIKKLYKDDYKNIFFTKTGIKFKLDYNGKLYFGDNNALYMKDVAEIHYDYSDYSADYLVRKDGSIWSIDLSENISLKQIRSGKNYAKRLSSPTNVKAKKKSNKKAKVTWKKVDGATKYTVYRATKKNGKYSKVGTAKGGSYTDKTVKKGKKYFYKVVANGSEKLYNSKKSDSAKVKI